ncbi:MAG: hypothetical protein LBG79_00560, partial [Spirochaetaceae bacterium]|nr:hypothetical protein [Spirochaetaceae bacterium]
MIHFRFSLFFLFFTLVAFNAAATDYTWNGSVDTDWETPNNWTPSGIPNSSTDSVKIPNTSGTSGRYPETPNSGGFHINDIEIEGGATLTTECEVRVYGNIKGLNGSAGTIILNSDYGFYCRGSTWDANGPDLLVPPPVGGGSFYPALTPEEGTCIFNRGLSVKSFYINSYQASPTSVTLNGTWAISHTLMISGSNLTLNIASGASVTVNNTIENNGTLNIASGASVTVSTEIKNNGTLDIEGTLTVASTCQFENNADVTINLGGTINNNNNINNKKNFTCYNDLTTGSFDNSDGINSALIVYGSVTIPASKTLTLSSDSNVKVGGGWTRYGSLNAEAASNVEFNGAGTVDNGNTGTFSTTPGTNAFGTVKVKGTNTYTFSPSGGVTHFKGPLTIDGSVTIAGTGDFVINGNLSQLTPTSLLIGNKFKVTGSSTVDVQKAQASLVNFGDGGVISDISWENESIELEVEFSNGADTLIKSAAGIKITGNISSSGLARIETTAANQTISFNGTVAISADKFILISDKLSFSGSHSLNVIDSTEDAAHIEPYSISQNISLCGTGDFNIPASFLANITSSGVVNIGKINFSDPLNLSSASGTGSVTIGSTGTANASAASTIYIHAASSPNAAQIAGSVNFGSRRLFLNLRGRQLTQAAGTLLSAGKLKIIAERAGTSTAPLLTSLTELEESELTGTGAGAGLFLSNSGALNISGTVSAAGTDAVISISAGAALTINEALTADTSISLNAGAALTINEALTVTSSGSITLVASGNITQGSAGILTAQNGYITKSTSATAVITLDEANKLSKAALKNESNGAMTFKNDQALSAVAQSQEGSIRIETTSGALTVENSITGSSISGIKSNAVSNPAGMVTLVSVADLVVNGESGSEGGALTLNAEGNVFLNNTNTKLNSAYPGGNGGAITVIATTGEIKISSDTKIYYAGGIDNGSILFSSPVSLTGSGTPVSFPSDSAFAAAGGNINFSYTVNGNLALNITNPAQSAVTFVGAVGVGTQLASLSVTGAVRINAASVRTGGDQTYNGAVTLGGSGSNANTLITTSSGNIRFVSTVNAQTIGGQGLTLNANGSGTVTFGGDVGGVTPIKDLAFSSGVLATGTNVTFLITGDLSTNGTALSQFDW